MSAREPCCKMVQVDFAQFWQKKKRFTERRLVSSKHIQDSNQAQRPCSQGYYQNHITNLVLGGQCCCCHLASAITACAVDAVGTTHWRLLQMSWRCQTLLLPSPQAQGQPSLSPNLQNQLSIQGPWFDFPANSHVVRGTENELSSILAFLVSSKL